MRAYTSSAVSHIKKVSVVFESNNVPDDRIRNYVTVEYEQDWSLGFLMEKKDDVQETKIMFLYLRGPSIFFCPEKPDILQVGTI